MALGLASCVAPLEMRGLRGQFGFCKNEKKTQKASTTSTIRATYDGFRILVAEDATWLDSRHSRRTLWRTLRTLRTLRGAPHAAARAGDSDQRHALSCTLAHHALHMHSMVGGSRVAVTLTAELSDQQADAITSEDASHLLRRSITIALSSDAYLASRSRVATSLTPSSSEYQSVIASDQRASERRERATTDHQSGFLVGIHGPRFGRASATAVGVRG